MELIDYPNYNEKLFVQTLSNGLTVYLQPKAGFNKTTAVLGVNYGSVDSQFMLNGEKVVQPAGIAHFLEHKMFDKKDYDVFELFNKTGARSNAFTSFTKTNYLFSTAESVKENLDILLDFVQIPYFTQAKVQREKGIIDQEINMYQNDPDNQAYFKTIASLYPNSVLANDIAGDIQTVDKITLEDVELAYRTFYRPENMSLFLCRITGHGRSGLPHSRTRCAPSTPAPCPSPPWITAGAAVSQAGMRRWQSWSCGCPAPISAVISCPARLVSATPAVPTGSWRP